MTSLVRARPREAHGFAKRGGAFVATSADSYAEVKPQKIAPRIIAKRVAPPPPALPTPDWLWTAVRTSEVESLRKVPEVRLHSYRTNAELLKQFKTVVAQHKNGSDAYVAAVIKDRPDLAGLPFLKGDACRLTPEQDGWLGQASRILRTQLEFIERRDDNRSDSIAIASDGDVKRMFDRFFPDSRGVDHPLRLASKWNTSPFLPAFLQILGPKEGIYRAELIRRLPIYPTGDDAAIAALVRLALFDPAADVRSTAIKALEHEPVERYAAKLLEGFRHASPHVAEHTADALVALKCKSLLPQVVDFLDEPDPAAPFDREENGDVLKAVREMVKINHHRNCMLCHAPATSNDPQSGVGTSSVNAPVPPPNEPFPLSSLRYYDGFGDSEAVVRVNETYLRQDFSRMEKVENPGKWPAQQRFDYLVRTRTLTSEEAAERQAKTSPDVPSAHHRAALSVLTRLTSTYLGAKASDWRDEIARRFEEDMDRMR